MGGLAPKIGRTSTEMRAAIKAMDSSTRDVHAAVDESMRATMGPVWRDQLNEAAQWPQDTMLITGNAITGGNPSTLTTATRTTPYGRALIPIEHWQGYEWGALPRIHHYTRHSEKGRPHVVRRDVNADKPSRRREGRVITKAVRAVLPRISAYWIQSVVRALTHALDTRT